ncbi:MAG: UDP-N-acetylmuramate--L-alanine ligase [Gammaproteobacteria bacterium]|nr:UDP-N-acetylmuramate--L-alanine ligase [Pseudomonadota bacterium]MCZ6732921.1 UDP-N-acetylmuramate--L-alanine ligase [Gammaproteobacteria bacterium]
MHNWVKRIHFVGIGGAGMSGIAEVLNNLHFDVSGSDVRESTNTRRLTTLGVPVHIGHKSILVEGVDAVVVSSAINGTNPEVMAAKKAKIPVVPRAEMLSELMRFQRGIAIAGTHGKTTTTSLIASVLAEGGLDPTFVIGGRLNSAASNARLGYGEYLVAEADESDASFLHLQPFVAVVTNIDNDHLSSYEGDFEKLKQAFVSFLHNLPFYGLAIVCLDDPVVREIVSQINKPIVTYGTCEEANVRARNIEQQGLQMRFTVDLDDHPEWLELTLNQPGVHNVLNALAAVAVARELGVAKEAIASGLANFSGIGRRFQVLGQLPLGDGDVILVDDYGHHPRELAATMAAARRGWPDRRLVVAFQPHRYSRTHDLLDDFSVVLNDIDALVITETYSAGESPISGADGRALCRAVRARGNVSPIFVEDVELLADTLSEILRPNDLLLIMGAGSIGQVASALPETLVQRWK